MHSCRSAISRIALMVFLAPFMAATPAGAASQKMLDACSMGEGQAAINACSRILRNRRESLNTRAMVLENRGITYLNMGKLDKAIRDFTQVLRWNPRAAGSLFNRADAYYKKGAYDKALHDLATLRKILGNDPSILEKMGDCWKAKQDPEKALKFYLKALKEGANDTSIYLKSAKLIMETADSEDKRLALELLEKAVEMEPGNIKAVCALGMAQEYFHLHARARENLSVCASKKPRDVQVWVNLGYALLKTGEFGKAAETLSHAIEMDAGGLDWEVYIGRAWAYYRLGRIADGLKDISKAGKGIPGDVMLKLVRAYLLLGAGRPNTALDIFRNLDLSMLTGDEITPKASIERLKFYGMGMALEQTGRKDEALKAYRQALNDKGEKLDVDGQWAARNARKAIERLTSGAKTASAARQDAGAASGQKAAQGKKTAPGKQAVPHHGKRLALVIGNSAYRHVPRLPNPVNDAHAVAERFRALGFEVIEKHDLDYEGMRKVLRDFARKAEKDDWAVVYYSGHGMEAGGVNYLIPVDAELKTVSDLEEEAIPLNRLMSKTAQARQLGLVVLDACRDNPFRRAMKTKNKTRSIGRGLARVEPQRGSIVVFAARAGQVAQDGDDGHSPFTSAFLDALRKKGLEVNLLFRQVRDEVLKKTAGEQEPFVYGSLPATPYYFWPPDKPERN